MNTTAIADLDTPASLMLKLERLNPAFLLESVTHGQNVGRYSFIGLDPVRTILHDDSGDLQQRIKAELGALESDGDGLTSALVGAIAFEAAHSLHATGRPAITRADQPLAAFVVPRAVVVFDHVSRRISIQHANGNAAAAKLLQEVRDAIHSPLPQLGGGTFTTPRATLTEEAFHDRVERAKAHIRDGDVFQVVLSLAFEGRTDLHPFQVYRALRHLNPSPYLYYFNFGDFQLVGSSPEALVTLKDHDLSIQPIAGTRPRGTNTAADVALADDLSKDDKELAEHNMLVDLARNDIGRVSEVGTVRVPTLRTIERYSHVMHLVSRVTGRLREGLTGLDAFVSAFPAGTVSGAPKVRVLQLIAELEGTPRGFYAGSVGYFRADGDFDQAITIRSIVLNNGHYSVQAGAGIVADSVPRKEYQEVADKAQALIAALEFARDHLGQAH
jgi:anthranilate synthase component I